LAVGDLEEVPFYGVRRTPVVVVALEEVGARRVLVAGSGPTVVGIFDDLVAADRAAAELPPRYANAIVSAPPRLG
jgi:4-diphosphocytidyl-2C-methyl-D-erythritol kinase